METPHHRRRLERLVEENIDQITLIAFRFCVVFELPLEDADFLQKIGILEAQTIDDDISEGLIEALEAEFLIDAIFFVAAAAMTIAILRDGADPSSGQIEEVWAVLIDQFRWKLT